MATRIALAAVSPGTRRRWLNGPAIDFLTLGGGSFIVLGAMAALFPRDDVSRAALAAAMLFLAHFVTRESPGTGSRLKAACTRARRR